MASSPDSDPHQQLRKALMSSDAFRSNDDLRALFTDPRLRAWKDHVPEATSVAARVNNLLSTMWSWRDEAGEPAVILILQALLDRLHPNEGLREKLATLATELKPLLLETKIVLPTTKSQLPHSGDLIQQNTTLSAQSSAGNIYVLGKVEKKDDYADRSRRRSKEVKGGEISSEDRIEQKIELADGVHVSGDVSIIGKVVINIFKRSAEWQDAALEFLMTHRYFLLFATVTQLGLLALFRLFKDLYQIPIWKWWLAASLLLIGSWAGYIHTYHIRSRVGLGMLLVTVVAFTTLLSSQAWSIIFPREFEHDVFGIVLAELGEGPDYASTEKARETSTQVYELLCTVVDEGFSSRQAEDPCEEPTLSPDPRIVAIKRVGIIPDSNTAYQIGKRLNADIVIWGQILTVNDQGATIRFKMIGTFDQVSTPDFPYVLPVSQSPASIFSADFELDMEGSTFELKHIVSQQTKAAAAYIIGVFAFLEQDYAAAVTQLKLAVETLKLEEDLEATEESLGLLYYYLGKAYHGIGRIRDGQAWLEEAQDKMPQEPAIYLSLAYGYRSLGEQAQFRVNRSNALTVTNTILAQDPNNLYALYDRGIIYELRCEPSQAVFDYEEIIRLDPAFFLAYINLGNALLADSRPEEAREALERALDIAEVTGANTASIHLRLARIWTLQQAYDAARVAYEEAITAAPHLDFIYREYAAFLESQQDYVGAREQLRNLIDKTYEKGAANLEMAQFLRRIGQTAEAEIYYRHAAREDPSNGVNLAYLAENLYVLGRREEAYELYEEALITGEPHYYPYSSYGFALQQDGDLERAAEMYERSLELRPTGMAELRNLLGIYTFLEQYEAAERLNESILILEKSLPMSNSDCQ